MRKNNSKKTVPPSAYQAMQKVQRRNAVTNFQNDAAKRSVLREYQRHAHQAMYTRLTTAAQQAQARMHQIRENILNDMFSS